MRSVESKLLRRTESRLRDSDGMASFLSYSKSLPRLAASEDATKTKEDIARIIMESLDAVLDQLFGKPARLAFYDLLETRYYMGRDDIPNQMETFLLLLERNFGKNGKAIQRDIAKRTVQNLVADRHSF